MYGPSILNDDRSKSMQFSLVISVQNVKYRDDQPNLSFHLNGIDGNHNNNNNNKRSEARLESRDMGSSKPAPNEDDDEYGALLV
jgi:hypothetical protein